jgi:hypothetical protein
MPLAPRLNWKLSGIKPNANTNTNTYDAPIKKRAAPLRNNPIFFGLRRGLRAENVIN